MQCINCNGEKIAHAKAKLATGKVINVQYCQDCGQVQHKLPLHAAPDTNDAEAKTRELKKKIQDSWNEDT